MSRCQDDSATLCGGRARVVRPAVRVWQDVRQDLISMRGRTTLGSVRTLVDTVARLLIGTGSQEVDGSIPFSSTILLAVRPPCRSPALHCGFPVFHLARLIRP